MKDQLLRFLPAFFLLLYVVADQLLPTPPDPEKLRIEAELARLQVQEDSLLAVSDSLAVLISRQDSLLFDLSKQKDTIYLTLHTREKEYQIRNTISDTTDMAADLRFLSAD